MKNIGAVNNTGSSNGGGGGREKEKKKKKELLKRHVKHRFTLKQTTEKLKPGY